jgi:hypothetical protein
MKKISPLKQSWSQFLKTAVRVIKTDDHFNDIIALGPNFGVTLHEESNLKKTQANWLSS